MSVLIDGRAMARELVERTAIAVAELEADGISPSLAVVLVGNDAASEVYVQRKIVQCAKAGADVVTCPLSAIKGLFYHPLTDIGLEKFLADHKKSQLS